MAEIVDVFNNKISLSKDDIKNFGDVFRNTFAGGPPRPLRSSNELKTQGLEKFQSALEEAIYAVGSSPAFILPEANLSAVGKLSDMEGESRDDFIGEIKRWLPVTLVVYLGSKGPFNEDRFWLRVSKEVTYEGIEDQYLFLGFPDLIAMNAHGSVITAFADSIGEYLDQGGFSSLVSFCQASGVEIPDGTRKFCFRKGMHVTGFPEGRHADLINDLEVIFAAMKGAKGSGKLEGIKFINNVFEPVKPSPPPPGSKKPRKKSPETDQLIRNFVNKLLEDKTEYRMLMEKYQGTHKKKYKVNLHAIANEMYYSGKDLNVKNLPAPGDIPIDK